MLYEYILTDLAKIAQEPHYADVVINNYTGETRRVPCADDVYVANDITQHIVDELQQDTVLCVDGRRLEATCIGIYVLDKNNNVVEGASVFCSYTVQEAL